MHFFVFVLVFWVLRSEFQVIAHAIPAQLRTRENKRVSSSGPRTQGPGPRAEDSGLRLEELERSRRLLCVFINPAVLSVRRFGDRISPFGFGFGAALRVYREREVPEHDVVLPDRHERAQLQFRRLPRTLDVRLPEPSMPSGHHPIPHS